MKKTISILLIVTMLLSMAAVALPTGAVTLNNSIGNLGLVGSSLDGNVTIINGTGSDATVATPGNGVTGAPSTGVGASSSATGTAGSTLTETDIENAGADITGADHTGLTVGATVTIPDEDGELPNPNWESEYKGGVKPWENEETKGDWTPIGSFKELTEAITNENPSKHAGKNFYLTDNITIDRAYSGIRVDYGSFVLDGNGKSITFNENYATIFSYIGGNSKISNVILKGKMKECSESRSPIGGHYGQACGQVTLINVLSTVSITNSDTRTEPIGGIIRNAADGSYFENVVFAGSITVKSAAAAVNIGGIVGSTSGEVTFKNCVSAGSITVENKADSNYHAIGGIIGQNNGKVVFENCTNQSSISVSATSPKGLMVGGFSGLVFGDIDADNCLNSGNISVTGGSATSHMTVGGYTGWSSKKMDFNNCVSAGKVAVSNMTNTNDGAELKVSGFVAHSEGDALTIDNCKVSTVVETSDVEIIGIGGFVGNGKGTIKNSTFSGLVHAKKGTKFEKSSGIGGFVGHVGGALSLTNCLSEAPANPNAVQGVLVDNGVLFNHYESGAGGIVGQSIQSVKLTLYKVVNEAPVSVDCSFSTGYHVGIGGVAGQMFDGDKTEHDFDYVYNRGNILMSKNSSRFPVGGIVGYTYKSWVNYQNCGNSGNITSPAGNYHIGGLNGFTDSPKGTSTFNNCFNTGDITVNGGTPRDGTLYVGGLSANSAETQIFTNCINTGDITISSDKANAFVGGIIAQNGNKDTKISTSTNTGDLSGTAGADINNMGGIIGKISGAVTIEKCLNTDNTIRIIEDAAYIGGIVGSIGGAGTIDSCVNEGLVTAVGDCPGWVALGGISGHSNGNGAVIKNTHSKGKIVFDDDTSSCLFVGGVVGLVNNNPLTIENTKSSGEINITGSASTEHSGIGGLVGWTNGTLEFVNCTHDGSIAVDGNYRTVGGLIGHLNARMIMKNCLAAGSITSGGEAYYVGGAVGLAANPLGYYYDKGDNAESDEDDVEYTDDVKNNVVSADITVNGDVKAVGGFVGQTNCMAYISNSTFNGSVVMTETAEFIPVNKIYRHGIGGFIGTADHNVTINNCKTEAKADAEAVSGIVVEKGQPFGHHEVGIGGIVGHICGHDNLGLLTITNVLNGAPITVNRVGVVSYDNGVGGVVGQVFDNPGSGKVSKFTNADNTGTITLADNTYNYPVGGILGYNFNNIVSFKDCDNGGAIKTPAGNYMIGGIHGYAYNAKAATEYTDCSFSGVIEVTNGTSATKGGKGLQVGGIAGCSERSASFDGCAVGGEIKVNGGSSDTVSVGGILPRLNSDNTINNCAFKGTITYSASDAGQVGGITATVKKNEEITDCSFDGTIIVKDTSASVRVGGYAASNDGCTLTFKNCDADGKIDLVSSGYFYAAGYVPYTYGTEIFDHCSSTVTINAATKGEAVGGFVGYHATNTGKIDIIDSYSDATINVSGSATGVGGFVATMAGVRGNDTLGYNTLNVSDSVCSADITVSDSGTATYAGGIIGYWTYKAPNNQHAQGTIATITDTVFNGSITTEGSTKVSNIGGVAGYVEMPGKTITVTAEDGTESTQESTDTLVSMTNVYTDGDITVGGNANNVAGFIGYLDAYVALTNCTNSLDIEMTNNVRDNWLCLSGFAGRKAGKTISFTNCTNEGDITHTYPTRLSNYILVGGFLGVSNHMETEISASVNTGDITIDSFCNNTSGIGGLVGWTNTDVYIDSSLNYGNVVHNGDVQAVGGIIGYSTTAARTVNVTNCMNLAEKLENNSSYLEANAGAIIGYAGATTTVSNCYNEADLTLTDANERGGNKKIGGIIGRSTGTVNVTECVNAGDIVSDLFAGGIVGQYTGGDMTIVRCVNVGAMTENLNSDPIFVRKGTASGNVVFKDNVYLDGSFEKLYDSGEELPAGRELDNAITNTKIVATYGFDKLAEAAENAGAILTTEDKNVYAEFSWNKLAGAYDTANAVLSVDRGISYKAEEDGTVVLAFLTQAEVNNAYYGLVDAIETLAKRNEKPELLKAAIEAAEKYVSENEGVMFMPDAWNTFATALAEANKLMKDPTLYTGIDPAVIEAVATALNKATAALDNNKGGYIYTAEDFSKLNGQDSTFYLMNDVKVTEAVKSFSGTLVGNGYTVTVEKNSLFESFNGKVSDVTIAGEADGASAVFGKASGDAEVSNIIVTVKSFSSSVLFAEIADKVEVIATNILAAGKAETLATDGVKLRNAYLTGVEYYSVAGNKKTEGEIAKGLAAYNINKAFGETLLVQVVGKDVYPTMGTPAVDGSNVVELSNDGKLQNKVKFEVSDGKLGELEEVPEIEIITDMLENAIGRAEALKEEDYEAASWTAFKAILASAKATLADKAATQEGLDKAASAVTIAIASLQKKAEAPVAETVDYSKLDASIAKAKALKEADYTEETWAMLKVMLTAAEAAKSSTQQIAVNSAVAALDSAILRLKEIKTETKDEEKKPTTNAPEEEGCGSVVGGSAIALVAVLALGAGVAFKKKED